jgi:spermidine synthase
MLGGPTTWHLEQVTPDLVQCSSVRNILYAGRSKYQGVELLETGSFGRCLVLDGKTQSSEADEFVYHESLVHPALLAHPCPETVYIAGGGEGATAREVLRHKTVLRAVMVDLDQEVVEICRKYLPDHHQGSFDDPRLELHFADAAAFLREHQGGFDVAVLDLPDPMEGGPAYQLYTKDFYQMVRERLNPGGLLVTQSGPASTLNYHEVFTAINRTLREVFPVVASYSVPMQSFGEPWGFTIASLGPDPAALSPEEIDRRLSERGASNLRFYDGVSHQGLFSLPLYLRRAIAQESRTITRENPLFVF